MTGTAHFALGAIAATSFGAVIWSVRLGASRKNQTAYFLAIGTLLFAILAAAATAAGVGQ